MRYLIKIFIFTHNSFSPIFLFFSDFLYSFMINLILDNSDNKDKSKNKRLVYKWIFPFHGIYFRCHDNEDKLKNIIKSQFKVLQKYMPIIR